eukprot:8659_1
MFLQHVFCNKSHLNVKCATTRTTLKKTDSCKLMSASPRDLVAQTSVDVDFDVPATTTLRNSKPSHAYRLSFIEQLTHDALLISDILEQEIKTDTPLDLVNGLPHIQPPCIQLPSIPSTETIDDTITRSRPTSISPIAIQTGGDNSPIDLASERPYTLNRIIRSNQITVADLSKSSIDFNMANKTISTSYIALYYLLRFCSVIITLFLAVMALNYAIGQVYVLSAADFFCPNYDEDTLRDYNLKHNLPRGRGSIGECGKINRPEVDNDKLRADPYEAITHFSSINVISCIAFLALFVCLFVLGVYHLVLCFYDACYHCIRNDITKNPRILAALRSKRNPSANQCIVWCKKWNLFLFRRYYPDSKWKIIALMLSQASEILMQCWALLIYGGVQLSLSFVIANEPQFVQTFAIIVGLNGVITGILWIAYVVQFKGFNAVFHGAFFQSITFVIDMIFDFVYTMFPFALYSGNASLLFNTKALATLHSESGILFLAAFIAITLLFQKCITVLRSFDPVAIQKRAKTIMIHNIDLIPYLQRRYAPTTSAHDTDEHYEEWKTQQKHRRLCIGSLGAIFLFFGVSLITTLSIYIHNAHQICSNPSQNVLRQHPELHYWNDYCSSKLTPLQRDSIPCDCRTFAIQFKIEHYEKYNFTKQHILSIMRNFKMMTFLDIEYHKELLSMVNHMSDELSLVQDQFYINLTVDCFASRRLNSLSLSRMFLIDLDWHSLSQLKWLQVLKLVNGIYTNPVQWKSIGQLTSLKYLDLRESHRFVSGKISESICNLAQLKYLNIETNLISRVPDCIADLTDLYGVNLRGLPNLNYITPRLFELPNIVSIIGYYGGFNASSIPAEWATSLTTVFFQETPLCDEVDTMTPLQLAFMDQFDPCYKPCGDAQGLHAWCATYDWGDGICQPECCNYDGGDCHQTCPCDRSLWFNDRCDLECNNTLCAYDFGDCVPQMQMNDTGECVYGSGCYDDWMEDGWCDSACDVLVDDECGDLYDCDSTHQCDSSSECSTAYLYLIHNTARLHDPKELIDMNETCAMWSFILLIDPTLASGSCTETFGVTDLNQDGYISFWEAIQLSAAALGLSTEKAYQVDCSLCLKDPSLYY